MDCAGAPKADTGPCEVAPNADGVVFCVVLPNAEGAPNAEVACAGVPNADGVDVAVCDAASAPKADGWPNAEVVVAGAPNAEVPAGVEGVPKDDCPKADPVAVVVLGALFAAVIPNADGWPENAENPPPPLPGPVPAPPLKALKAPPVPPNAPVAGLMRVDCG